MSISFDVSDLLTFAGDCERAAAAVPGVLRDAGMSAGSNVQARAQINAQASRKTGHNADNIGPPEVTIGGDVVRVEIAAKAVSASGFPYPIALEKGRRGFSATRTKFLKFTGKDGKTVFAKSVGPAAAKPFLGPALDDSAADIEGTFGDAADELLRMVGG